MLKIKIYEGFIEESSLVGYIIFNDMPRSDFWRSVAENKSLVLDGCFHRYDQDSRTIFFEGLAGPGCKCDGCLQDECDREYSCNFCLSRTLGAEESLTLPFGATFTEK